MRMKAILGSSVLDSKANDIGKIVDLEFDSANGKFTKIIVSLKKGLISNDEIEIDYNDISTIGDYVLLKTTISEKVDDVEIIE